MQPGFRAGQSKVRLARAGEKLEALDDQTYQLSPSDLVIADSAAPVAIAGVMGGKPTGVTESTTEVVLEAAWFDPATVRRTSRRLGLSSDSSYRYERRVDPGGLLAARDRALQLLLEITGATIASPSVIGGQAPAGNGPITLVTDRIAGLLGANVPEPEVRGFLDKIGCALVSGSIREGKSVWQPPTFRHDLAREVDLIEEVARLHGLEEIPAQLVTGWQAESDADRAHDRLSRLRHALAARGWDECVTDALIDRRFALADSALEMANPLSELQTHLRPALKTPLLQVTARNLAKGVAQLHLFEAGRVSMKSAGRKQPSRSGSGWSWPESAPRPPGTVRNAPPITSTLPAPPSF